MPRFYIEIPHEEEAVACLRAVKVLQETGSHFLTNACYGCMDNDHTARLMIDLDNREDALMIVPPAYRQKAKVVQLISFSREEVEKLLTYHSAQQ
jgi:hypothetical protein